MRKIGLILLLVSLSVCAQAARIDFNELLNQFQLKISISANERAKVYLNGKYYGETNLQTRVAKGTHKLVLIPLDEGFNPLETTIQVQQNESFNFKLEPLYYQVQIKADQAADVFINGEMKGKTNLTLKLKKGQYKIKLQAKGMKSLGNFRPLDKFGQVVQGVIEVDQDKVFEFKLSDKKPSFLGSGTRPSDYKVQINANSQAKVIINGNSLGTTPLNISLKKGIYNLKLDPLDKSYESSELVIVIHKDESYHYTLPPLSSTLRIQLPQNTQLWINNSPIDYQVNQSYNILPGTYQVKIVYYGLSATSELVIRPGKQVVLNMGLILSPSEQ